MVKTRGVAYALLVLWVTFSNAVLAAPTTTHVVLLGDADQQPVEAASEVAAQVVTPVEEVSGFISVTLICTLAYYMNARSAKHTSTTHSRNDHTLARRLAFPTIPTLGVLLLLPVQEWRDTDCQSDICNNRLP